jgi:hypothetical protein
MDSTKLVELVFDDSSFARTVTYQEASQSLIYNPHQLFNLLLGGESSARFSSNLAVYGKRLANIFDYFRACLVPESKAPLQFGKNEFNVGLVEEMLRVFTISLLARNHDDTRSQETIADIVMSVIKLSHPEALEYLGEKLGVTPGILQKLIIDGRMRDLSYDQPDTYNGLVSGRGTQASWRSAISNLTRGCELHRSAVQRMTGERGLRQVIRVFPCQTCIMTGDQPIDIEEFVPRENDIFGMDLCTSTFENLLGSHLGEWKIILSAQAMKDLRGSVDDGKYTENHSLETPPGADIETR